MKSTNKVNLTWLLKYWGDTRDNVRSRSKYWGTCPRSHSDRRPCINPVVEGECVERVNGMMMYATASCRRRLDRITSPAALTLLSIPLSLHQRADCCSEMRRLLLLLMLAPPRSTIDDVSPLTYKPAAVTAPRSPEGCNTARGAACVPALHAGAACRPGRVFMSATHHT